MADSWGSTPSNQQNQWQDYGNNLDNWGGYLQGQMGQYAQRQAPTAPDITQNEWGQKHQAVMSDMMSGQRNQLDDYVRRAALTGVQRGGYNTSGSPNYASGLQREAINALAAGYDTRYNNALGYMKDLANFQQGQYAQDQGMLKNLWEQQGANLGRMGQDVANQRSYDVARRQLADEMAKREWQTGERIGTEQFQAGQTAKQRDLELRLKQMGIDSDMARQMAQQSWTTSEREGTQQYQAGQAAQQRSWQSQESQLGREGEMARLQQQLAQQRYQSDLSAKLQREGWQFQGSESEKQRALQLQLQQQGFSNDMAKLLSQQQFTTSERLGTQGWTSRENELNREIQKLLKQGDWASAMNLQMQAQQYARQEKASDRQYAEDKAAEE